MALMGFIMLHSNQCYNRRCMGWWHLLKDLIKGHICRYRCSFYYLGLACVTSDRQVLDVNDVM